MEMKLFNVCVGNPPYNKTIPGTHQAPSLYNLFLDKGYEAAPIAIFVTPARFLFRAGNTPSGWCDKMLQDVHLKVADYAGNCKDVFPEAEIPGGVAVTLRNDDAEYGAIGTFIPNAVTKSIIDKVLSTDPPRITIHLANKFDLDALYEDFPEIKGKIGSGGKERRLMSNIFRLSEVFHDFRMSENDIKILGLVKNRRVEKYINKKYLSPDEKLGMYKVLVPQSNGSGAIDENPPTTVIGVPLVIDPGVGSTATFIYAGVFSTKNEAQACLKYIKSKFARFMLATLKVTQGNTRTTWANVPTQDFSADSDIDWTQSVHEIDLQLYRIYGLDEKEIRFVEENIRDMD